MPIKPTFHWNEAKFFFENWWIQKCIFFQIQSMMKFKVLKSGTTDEKGCGCQADLKKVILVFLVLFHVE